MADPDAEHVELQQPVVHSLAEFQIHEEVIDEAAAPGRNRTDQMAPREKAVLLLPWHHCRNCCQDVHYWNACGKETEEDEGIIRKCMVDL